ncbi:hypothetical protein M3P21_04985 [Ruegeria sp. 2012CJ41-6]|uniref:DUF3303 domain-containing protein n=1 Tax=Ruegeria spongiae TaxID=2942209 RepID=A0ABT0PZ35_9RHOB|nr:hypothetical protein [Ruegeria spongiae]MCL6282881.1 hypothetical protein [Ruegeria spongiae]
MATHVLWQADVADFDVWLKVFHEDKAARKSAGVKDLHVWRDPDRANHAIAMFEITDLNKASAFLQSEDLAMYHERGGVAHVEVKLLEPV